MDERELGRYIDKLFDEIERGIYRDELWYKEPENQVYTYDIPGVDGDYIFSIDKKRVFNFWGDYPEKLTKEELIIFNKENSTMAKLRDGDKYLAKLTGDDSYLINKSEADDEEQLTMDNLHDLLGS